MRISDWSSDVCSSDLASLVRLCSAEPGAVSPVLGLCRQHHRTLREFRARAVGVCRLRQAPVRAACRCQRWPQCDGRLDRKSVVSGKSVSVRVDLGGRRTIKKKKKDYMSSKHK